jgi:hypothetical protein
MVILRVIPQALTELGLGQRALPQVAGSTCGQDVRDVVASTSAQWDSMIRLEWTGGTAVSASMTVSDEELRPLGQREVADGTHLTSPTSLPHGPSLLGILLAVAFVTGPHLLQMAELVGAVPS